MFHMLAFPFIDWTCAHVNTTARLRHPMNVIRVHTQTVAALQDKKYDVKLFTILALLSGTLIANVTAKLDRVSAQRPSSDSHNGCAPQAFDATRNAAKYCNQGVLITSSLLVLLLALLLPGVFSHAIVMCGWLLI
jgi:hypothetical protein